MISLALTYEQAKYLFMQLGWHDNNTSSEIKRQLKEVIVEYEKQRKQG